MIILDTNVISELSRPNPSPSVVDWFISQSTQGLHLTAISEAELRYGLEVMPIGRHRDRLLAATEGMLHKDYAGRILPFDSYAARAYAVIAAERRAAGRPISYADCQIAAIARSVGAAVATRNVRDFEGYGVRVVNPWSDT